MSFGLWQAEGCYPSLAGLRPAHEGAVFFRRASWHTQKVEVGGLLAGLAVTVGEEGHAWHAACRVHRQASGLNRKQMQLKAPINCRITNEGSVIGWCGYRLTSLMARLTSLRTVLNTLPAASPAFSGSLMLLAGKMGRRARVISLATVSASIKTPPCFCVAIIP